MDPAPIAFDMSQRDRPTNRDSEPLDSGFKVNIECDRNGRSSTVYCNIFLFPLEFRSRRIAKISLKN